MKSYSWTLLIATGQDFRVKESKDKYNQEKEYTHTKELKPPTKEKTSKPKSKTTTSEYK